MRKIVGGFAISIDGYIEGPDGESDWIIMDKEFDFATHMKRFDTFLFGRKSYEKILESGTTNFPGIKSYIFSNSLKSVHDNFHLVQGEVMDTVTAIKKESGKEIAVYGGAKLVSSLLNLGLIDELNISFIPIVLGKGKRMVDGLNKRENLILIDSKKFSGGTVQLIYTVKK